MSQRLDRLETSYGTFNENYSKLRRMAVKSMREEGPDAESQLMLDIIDNLDAVLDEIVMTLKNLDRKIKKS